MTDGRIGLAMGAIVMAVVSGHAAPKIVENFEGAAPPPGWQGEAGGAVQISSERFKSGTKSLCWNWNKPGAVLRYDGTPVPMAEKVAFGMWIYCEKPVGGILELEFLNGDKLVGSCWYALNFKGWRPLGAPYEQVRVDANASTSPSFNALRLVAPRSRATASAGASPGRVYIDYVNFQCRDVLLPDNQQPWVGVPEILKTKTPEKFLYESYDISVNRPWLPRQIPEGRMSDEEQESLALMKKRVLLPDSCYPRQDKYVLAAFRRECQIKRLPDGTVTGKPIVSAIPFGFNRPPDGQVLYNRASPAKAVGASGNASLMRRLAEAYTFEIRRKNVAEAEKLKQAFFELCDHMLDQGFADGNGNSGIWALNPGVIVGMHKELKQTGRLTDMLLMCISCGTTYSDGVLTLKDLRTANIFGSPRNTDGFGNYHEILRYLARIPDRSLLLQRLYAYRRTLSLLCDPQLGEPFAWDGTVHHHMMFHPGYGEGALLRHAYNLRDTCFSLTPEALAMIKKSATMLSFTADYKGVIPANCPGYTGVPLGAYSHPMDIWNFGTIKTADTVNGVDPDIAGICLAFYQKQEELPPIAQQFTNKGFKPRELSGHMSVNGACIAVHRRDDWFVTIAGRYKFRRGIEPNYPGSLFNKYSKHGSVFVCSSGDPVSTFASGYSLEGWDARHYPGSTSYIDERPAEICAKSRGKAENVLAGGTNLGGDGIWGMNAVGQFYDPNTRWAKKMANESHITYQKSAFCFDNRITLITTGIGRCELAGKRDRQLTLGTTLWQNSIGAGGEVWTGPKNLRLGFNVPKKPPAIPPESEPIWINGASVEEFPWKETLSSGTAHVLVDNKHTGYYVHPGNSEIMLARRRQSWIYPCGTFWKQDAPNPNVKTDFNNFDPTEGNFSVAWFQHGNAPAITECVYTLIPRATPEGMARFAEEMQSQDPPYRILEKSALAHVLYDRDSVTTGYVVFDPSWRSNRTPLQAVNRPCTIMIKASDGGVRISAATTDMDAWTPAGIQLSGEIVLTLVGPWRVVDDPSIRVTGNGKTTLLHIPYKTFMPVVFSAKPATAERKN